jgi:hypothetical protein
MQRILVSAGLLAAIVVPVVSGEAPAAASLVVPVKGNGGCTPQPPVLLRPGALPRTPLRISLTAIANRSSTLFDTETVHQRTLAKDGAWHASHGSAKVAVIFKLDDVAQNRVHVTERFSIPGTEAKDASPLARVRFTGFLNALNGGGLKLSLRPGGTPAENAALRGEFQGASGNDKDRLPLEAVGAGATWRVVNCEPVDEIPARETRTYTLRSVTGGVAVMTFRDVVDRDLAHLELGSTEVAGVAMRVHLSSLRGTATGTMRLPLGHAFQLEQTTTTRFDVVMRASAPNTPTANVHSSIVDEESIKGPSQ